MPGILILSLRRTDSFNNPPQFNAKEIANLEHISKICLQKYLNLLNYAWTAANMIIYDEKLLKKMSGTANL